MARVLRRRDHMGKRTKSRPAGLGGKALRDAGGVGNELPAGRVTVNPRGDRERERIREGEQAPQERRR